MKTVEDFGFKKLKPEKDQTATLGFESAISNVILCPRGYCPQCLKPMGIKGHNRNSIKVYINDGIDYWCQKCVKKLEKKNYCLRYNRLSKKEKKQLKKFMKGNKEI